MVSDENQRRLTANSVLSNKRIIFKNLMGGLAWGFGSVIGATIVVALLVGVLNVVNFVPIIGDLTSQIVDIVNQKNPSRYIDE